MVDYPAKTILEPANTVIEYAAAFFLLADCLRDAVNVILNQLKDLQLAIAVTRVYEGEDGPVLKEILTDKVLPLAAREGNRWLASWAFWMLHRRDMSVRALIVSIVAPTLLGFQTDGNSRQSIPFWKHPRRRIFSPSCSSPMILR